MEGQVKKTEHFLHSLLFEFNRGVKESDAPRAYCTFVHFTESTA